jgi:glutathione S-transferase
MQLIGSLSSPYVRKVRVVLAEKHIDCGFLQEDVWSRDTKIQLNNPLGKVPSLILDDGSSLYDSRVICEYLDAFPPSNYLIPLRNPERFTVRRWEALSDGVLDAGVLMRLEYTQRTPAQRSEKWLARQRAKVTTGLEVMAKDLGDHAWCAGMDFTLADIAVGCALGWISFRHPELEWRKTHANLSRHFDKLLLRPSFATSVPRA